MIHRKTYRCRLICVAGWALSGAFAPCASAATPHAPAPADSSPSQGCPVALPPLALPAKTVGSSLVADQAALSQDVATATGHAHLTRNGQALEAPFVRYDRDTTEAEARGGLEYRRQGLYLTADQGNVNTTNESGEFTKARYSVLTNGARGAAATMRSLGNNQYRLTDASYTTCDGKTKAWLLSAKRIVLDRATGRGVAHDATFRVYGVPVLYTPYLNFPIDDQRHTGFLPPTIGVTSDAGFELGAPYYINLAPNYDATIIPRVMSKRGAQLTGEFRYLTPHERGQIDGQLVPYDYDYGSERDLEHLQSMGEINKHLGFSALYTRVSDDDYFDDLSNDLVHSSTTNLERSFQLTAVATGLRFTVLAQDFQTLDDHFNGLGGRFDDNPYRRLPDAHLHILTPSAPFQLGFDGDFTNFERSGSVNAYRFDARPRILWGIDHGGWYLHSEAAYRLTRYDLHNTGAETGFVNPTQNQINREIPSFEADAGLRLSRTLRNGWVQTLEPKLQYLLVDYVNQSHIPVFDSGIPTLDYDQLFSENRFTGIDRIAAANQVTLGVTSRFISPTTGRTVGQIQLGRMTSFRRLRVSLPNSGVTGYSPHGSDYLASGLFSPSDSLTSQLIAQYNPDTDRIDRAVADATFGPRTGYQLSLGYRYYRDFRPARTVFGSRDDTTTTLEAGQFETLSQVAVGVRAPLTDRIDFIGRWNYSLEHHDNVETLAGVEYRPACCYAVRAAFRHYVSDNNGNQSSAFLVQFVFRGLGHFGESMSSFVDRDIFSPTMKDDSYNSFDTIGSP